MLVRIEAFVAESCSAMYLKPESVAILPPGRRFLFDRIFLRSADNTFWVSLKIRLRIWRMLWKWEPGTVCTIEADPIQIHFCTHVPEDPYT